jgi:hypothetical protein
MQYPAFEVSLETDVFLTQIFDYCKPQYRGGFSRTALSAPLSDMPATSELNYSEWNSVITSWNGLNILCRYKRVLL